MEESESIAATLAGDVAAFANIVSAYQRAVYNLALRMLGDGDEATDAAQEVFLRAYTQLAGYDQRRPFSSWLLAIAAHYCIDVRRRRRGTRVDIELAESAADENPGPEDVLLAHERRDEVRLLLDKLADGYRLVIVLRYWYEMPCEDIANATGLSVSAVKTRLHRARALLVKAVDNATGSDLSALPPQAAPASNIGHQGEHDRALWRREETPVVSNRRHGAARDDGCARGTPWHVRIVPSICRPA